MILENIKQANDIKKLNPSEYELLAREIRWFLVNNVSKTGGHLASNLGAVELTMALHIALDLPQDKIIWDVGHQSYVHKMLTGRMDAFPTLRQYGGLSGFPKRRESEYDAFNTGHSSTSIAAAYGIACAEHALGDDQSAVVAVIGDGALTGGLALEGLNNLSKLNRNLIIILNDNEMSISHNVGGMSRYLTGIRTGENYNLFKSGLQKGLKKIPKVGDPLIHQLSKTKSSIKQLVVPGMLFENMDIMYLGPVDGHNVSEMVKVIKEARKINHAVLIHVMTVKGKGYRPAMEDPQLFHGIGPFDIRTGKPNSSKAAPDYSSVFGKALLKEAQKNPNIVAITAAMESGTGLVEFAKELPERFYDVGIAEDFAVTFAAGLCVGGLKPFFAVYSSFLQRAYDEIAHDVCIQNLPVTFCIDRAGLVGNDGETHQGIFDISYLSTIPNMNILAPKNAAELEDAIAFASGFNAPLAIRYPKGTAYQGLSEFRSPIVLGKSEMLYKERDIAILAVGSMVEEAVKVREELKKQGKNVTLVNVRFVKPIDEEMIDHLLEDHDRFITIEENVIIGSYGMAVLRYMNQKHKKARVINLALPNAYVEQGSRTEQFAECQLDVPSMLKRLEEEGI